MTDEDPAVSEARPIAVIDIDGVVADVRHRLHHLSGRRKNWDAFFAAATEDPPHAEGLTRVRELDEDHEILFLTGRPERCRRDTEQWLARHGLGGRELLMRPDTDRRPAAILKVEALDRRAGDRRVGIVVDDDVRVVEAMRQAGHPVEHADWEARAPTEEVTLREAQEVEGRT